MGLSGASLAALLLFHTEDFWFRLGTRTIESGTGIDLKITNVGNSNGSAKVASSMPADNEIDNDNNGGTVDKEEGKKKKKGAISRLKSRLRARR